jgi:hypothetical protein
MAKIEKPDKASPIWVLFISENLRPATDIN